MLRAELGDREPENDHEIKRATKQTKPGTLLDYVNKMKKITARGEIKGTLFISYIIGGIQDHHMNKAILFNAKTLQELRTSLIAYENRKHETVKIVQMTAKNIFLKSVQNPLVARTVELNEINKVSAQTDRKVLGG